MIRIQIVNKIISLYMELKVRSHIICNLLLIRNSIYIRMKNYIYQREVLNFTILKHRTCKMKLSLAITSNTVSFTFSLLLHHCYHHPTLSYSHLLSQLCFGTAPLLCSVCVLTFGVLPSLQLFLHSAF